MKISNQEMMHWWQGYVVIEIRGKKIERLINRMMNKRFSAWQFMRTSEEHAQLAITVREFFELRPLLKETGCRCRVISRYGLPFYFKRVRKRVGLYVGILLFATVLYAASMMVWQVEIEGVTTPETELEIREELKKLGVKPGSFKFSNPDYRTIQREIMKVVPSTTWIGFQYQGTTAQIKVVEKTLPDVKKEGGPRNLIATKKAVIYDLFVEQGQPMVKPNQYVRPGDLLVSGVIGGETNPQIVSATGKILGEVWYEGQIELPLVQKKSIITGERTKKYYVQFGSFALQVWGFGDLPFQKYETDHLDYKLSWKNWTFPVSWKVEQLQEVDFLENRLTEEAAVELGLELAKEQLQQKIPADAVIKEENILRKKVENGKVYIKMHYTVIEEIASEQPLVQPNENSSNQGD